MSNIEIGLLTIEVSQSQLNPPVASRTSPMGERVRSRAEGRYTESMMLSWPMLRAWARDLAVALTVGAFVGVLGPFGSFLNGGLPIRVGYFMTTFGFGVLVYRLSLGAAHQIGRRFYLPPLAVLGLGIVIALLPMTLISRVIATQLWPRLTTITMLDWGFQCLVLSLPLCLIYEIVLVRWRKPVGLATADLPIAFGREVICLQMEDHYVRVHTANGSTLHLMTMSDAIKRTANPGAQVHRSWWVARDAIVQGSRDGRNLRLKLLSGLEVPVARRSVALLKADGLIED